MATPWVIELGTPAMKNWLKVTFDSEISIGSSVPGGEEQPDIDLSAYGAAMQGVAPRHLGLFVQEGQLFVVDLGSLYGTRLNGQALIPDKAYSLQNGAKLELGQMPLEIRLTIAPSHSQTEPDEDIRIGNGEMILIVEDDPEVAKVLSIIMARVGYRPVVTHEVVTAIRSFNKQRPSAILLDLMLPDMNGLEFCRYVRRDTIQNTIPVLVISADTTAREEAMRAGADVFFTKPFKTHELVQEVSRLITESQAGSLMNRVGTKQLVGTAPLEAFPAELRRYGVVLYVAGYSDAPIALDVQKSVSFGRAAGPGSLETHVDLSRFEASTMGVSRLHMVLHPRDGKFYIEDKGSMNGTFRNGNSHEKGEIVEVRNGDEIRLGALRMYIYFIEDTEIEDE